MMDDTHRSPDDPPLHNEIHRFFDLSIDLLAIVSNGRFMRLNPAWETTFGYSIEELLAISPYDLIHPEDIDRTKAARQQIVAEGGTLTRFENRYRHKDGTYRWLEWAARRYPQEDVSYCIARDVTERKGAEEALRQSEEAQRALLNSVSNLAIMLKPDGTVLMLNQKQAETLGKPVDEIVGRSIYDFADTEEMRQQRKAWIDEAMGHGEPHKREYERGGRFFEAYTAPIHNDQGEIVAFVATSHDITHIKQTEETLHSLLDSMPNMALMMRLDGTVTAVNRKQAEFIGKPVEEIIDRNAADLMPDDVMTGERITWVQEAVVSGTPRTFEFERDGEYGETTIIPVVNRQNEVYAVVVSTHDITQLKRTEAALRKSEEQFRSVLESAAEGILLTNQAGEIVLVNRHIEIQFGYTREELIGQSVDMLLPEANRAIHTQHRRAYAAAPDVRPMGVGRDLSGRNKDGSVFPVEVSLSYVQNNGELLLMALVVDITERKQAELALRKSEEQFRSVLEAAAEGILVTDSIGNIVLVNRTVLDQFGYTREELVGAPVEILLPEALRTTHIEHRKGYSQHPDTRSMGVGRELKGRRKDGTEFPIEVSLSYTQGDEMLIMAFIVDISERKQIELERLDHEKLQAEMKKEREIIELRQRFMSMISHEFRTPLTAIASSCELLTHYYERLTDEQRRERIRGLNAHVHTMVGLLDDILMLNRIQAGMAEFKPEPLDVAQLSRRVLDTAALVDQGQHRIEFSSDKLPENIPIDQRILEHILTNLLSNAIKYSPPGTKIDFRLSSQGERITFRIRDEGYGIPDADQPHLFEPFRRARNVGDIPGTGLGLAIVKSSVELHGGSVRFQSAEGKGTTFWVDLPVTSSTLPL